MTDATAMLVGLGQLPFCKSFVFAALACAIAIAAVVDSPSSTASASVPAADTHLTISLGTSTHSSAVTPLAPGDTFSRALDVSLSSRTGAKVALRISAIGHTSLLDTDATNGLQITIDRCVSLSGWRRTAGGYFCPGPVAHVLAPVAVANAKDRRLALATMATGRPQHVLLSFRLPGTAGNAFEHLVSSLRFTFSVRP